MQKICHKPLPETERGSLLFTPPALSGKGGGGLGVYAQRQLVKIVILFLAVTFIFILNHRIAIEDLTVCTAYA